MKRVRQTLEEILDRLSPVEVDWRDETADAIIAALAALPAKPEYATADVAAMMDGGSKIGLELARLVLDRPKDDFYQGLKAATTQVGHDGRRPTKACYAQALTDMGLLEALRAVVNTPVTWRDLLIERLKTGRGSAIRGQRRGRSLEDFVERIVREVFGTSFQIRGRFTGKNGLSDEKADFAIPTLADPVVLIEVKAYGSTGSKQTDVLGDMNKIIAEKRRDTVLVFVTDGVVGWSGRKNDLRKLVHMQTQGDILRIYTMKDADALRDDLATLRGEYGLPTPAPQPPP